MNTNKLTFALCAAVVLVLTWRMGYVQAWNIQENRRLECGAGWYESLQLVSELMPYYESFPKCQEDVVFLGTGQFEAGRWTGYACGPAVDDYIQASP